MGLFFDNNKNEYSEEELQKIRERNEAFDFGLSGKSNDDPDKWIDELSIMDMIMED